VTYASNQSSYGKLGNPVLGDEKYGDKKLNHYFEKNY